MSNFWVIITLLQIIKYKINKQEREEKNKNNYQREKNVLYKVNTLDK